MHGAEGKIGTAFGLALLGFMLVILFLPGCVLPKIPWPNQDNINFNVPQQLPPATVGEPYSYSFCQPDTARSGAACGGLTTATNPTGGKPPYSIIYGEGIHAPGINLQLNGLYLGTPTREGTYGFSVCARDSSGTSACEPVAIQVNGNAINNGPGACASRFCEAWQACEQGRCAAKAGFCNGNADCGQGKECNVRAHTCQSREGPTPGTGGNPACPSGYVLGEDGLCHTECGHGFYCTGDSQCYNGQCIMCQQGYYLGADGLCYSDSTETYVCPDGYVLGEDYLCHEECGQDTYCGNGAQCYNGECLTCPPGNYLGIDGYCYEEGTGQYECPDGYNLAADGYCYPEGGGDIYQCPDGYAYGNDGLCHEECGSGFYCTGDSQCYNGECLSCDTGYYLATDGYCHPEGGGTTYECPGGYAYGDDGLCHEECGTDNYCAGDSECCGGECVGCNPGYYLGTDCACHSESSCNPGYVLGDDGLCYPGCGSGTYCTGDSQCCGGDCISCNPGYYLGADCRCYPESSCDPGYVLGNDDMCHPECGYGTYCTGSYQCCGGQCLSCPSGSYLATDCNCHSESSCPSGYVLGYDDLCHPECGYGTYCTGGQCCGGSCISCPGGYYLAVDCLCYPY